jgi:hypothetical protein
MRKFYWTGICKEERIAGINRMQACIRAHGFVVDFKFFSDISLSLFVEIEGQYVKDLYAELSKFMDITSEDEMDIQAQSHGECLILFHVTFSKGTGNMKVEVPAVPG